MIRVCVLLEFNWRQFLATQFLIQETICNLNNSESWKKLYSCMSDVNLVLWCNIGRVAWLEPFPRTSRRPYKGYTSTDMASRSVGTLKYNHQNKMLTHRNGKASFEVIWAFSLVIFWTLSKGGVSDMFHWKWTSGQTREIISLWWPELEEVAEEREVCCPHDPSQEMASFYLFVIKTWTLVWMMKEECNVPLWLD